MRPDKSVILEATCDLSSASIKTAMMPSGTVLLTVASPDKSFEAHLNVGNAKSAELAVSAKTGGPIVRVSDVDDSVMLTLVLDKTKMAEFGELRATLGDTVNFGDASDQGAGCRLVTGEELEIELTDLDTPMILDCFARWCGPCQLMVPVMDEVASKLGPKCRVLKFDTDEYPDMADLLRVEGLPTILFMGAGETGGPKVQHRFEGAAQQSTYLTSQSTTSLVAPLRELEHRSESPLE
eukprot:CAMPEP_0172582464 /NCGR_PEP_ID=MMETSP1068-20121228/1876_1 /TAXON_ID=35684 /ORGANISM="Pseudopedinella elastica, Strain CCMP716" /LENGTH=237 /DNA_ID=CAMNT_0013375823 /DNA_START=163 /DNA_END=877 /DNA_ORIENTATION=-